MFVRHGCMEFFLLNKTHQGTECHIDSHQKNYSKKIGTSNKKTTKRYVLSECVFWISEFLKNKILLHHNIMQTWKCGTFWKYFTNMRNIANGQSYEKYINILTNECMVSLFTPYQKQTGTHWFENRRCSTILTVFYGQRMFPKKR